MTSIRHLIVTGRARLAAAGVDTPGLDAELLLAHCLGTSRSHLLAALREDVSAAIEACFDGLQERRAQSEPVAYITGVREFWGRPFEVNSNVLIPRPETELLVSRALELNLPPGAVVADVGTGSGCVAISVALDLPTARVCATDTSVAALAVAARNAVRLGAGEKVTLLHGPLLDAVPEPVALVLANLPYISSDELETLQPDVRFWEPRSALDGGRDGLDPIRGLLDELPAHALLGAVCLLEIDPRQFQALAIEVEERLPGATIAGLRDLSGRIRVAEVRLFTPP